MILTFLADGVGKMPSGRFYDVRSGAVLPLSVAAANPSAFSMFDVRHGGIITAAQYFANPSAYGYYDPDSGLGPQPAVNVNLANYGITDWTPLLGVQRLGPGIYIPTKEAADFKSELLSSTTVQVYYVDPSRPNNSGDGLTPATAKQDVSAAWALAPASQTNRLRVIMPTSRILWGPRGTTTNASATKNILLEADDGGEIIIAAGALTAPPTWTPNGDGTFTCSTGINSGTAPSPPVDWSPAARARQSQGLGFTLTQTSGATAATDPAVRATLQPGQAYAQLNSGTNNLTIRPVADAAQSVWSDYLVPGAADANTFLMKAEDAGSASPTFYLSRVLVNGPRPIVFQNRRTTAGGRPVIVADRCAGIGTIPGTNGWSQLGACQFITFDSAFDACGADGFNPHSTNPDFPTWISGQCQTIDVRPRAGVVGLGLAGNANLYTGHEDARGLVIAPSGGLDVGGRPASYIDNAKVTFFGGNINPSTRTVDSVNQTVHAGGNAVVTLVETGVSPSPGVYDLQADGGGTAAINCLGMTQGALRTVGNVTFSPLPG